MVPEIPAAGARINPNGSYSSGSEISCDTGAGISQGGLGEDQLKSGTSS